MRKNAWLLLIPLFLFSCTVQKRRYMPGFYVQHTCVFSHSTNSPGVMEERSEQTSIATGTVYTRTDSGSFSMSIPKSPATDSISETAVLIQRPCISDKKESSSPAWIIPWVIRNAPGQTTRPHTVARGHHTNNEAMAYISFIFALLAVVAFILGDSLLALAVLFDIIALIMSLIASSRMWKGDPGRILAYCALLISVLVVIGLILLI